jgi:NAD(P)-dependent dehydrogenase (short-subunit alcohol dehydrogenase family)
MDKILASYPNVEVQILEFDLGSLDSVREAVGEVNVELDVLINNAAVMASPYGTTSDGFETQFRVAHLGHFLLTNLLSRDRKIKDSGRVVNVGSDGHRLGNLRFDDPGFEVRSFYYPKVLWEAQGLPRAILKRLRMNQNGAKYNQ